MGQCGNGCVGGSAGIAEDQRDSDDADDRGDDGQGPDGFARRERLGVQNAEVLRSLVVLAHRIGHAGAGVHAAQRGADQRQEHRDGFGQHEVLAVALAQQRSRRQ